MNESKQDKGLENMETLVSWTTIDFLLTQLNENVTHRGFFSSKSGPGFKPGTFQHFVFLSEALTAQFSHDVAYLINFPVVTHGIFLIYYIAWP